MTNNLTKIVVGQSDFAEFILLSFNVSEVYEKKLEDWHGSLLLAAKNKLCLEYFGISKVELKKKKKSFGSKRFKIFILQAMHCTEHKG